MGLRREGWDLDLTRKGARERVAALWNRCQESGLGRVSRKLSLTGEEAVRESALAAFTETAARSLGPGCFCPQLSMGRWLKWPPLVSKRLDAFLVRALR